MTLAKCMVKVKSIIARTNGSFVRVVPTLIFCSVLYMYNIICHVKCKWWLSVLCMIPKISFLSMTAGEQHLEKRGLQTRLREWRAGRVVRADGLETWRGYRHPWQLLRPLQESCYVSALNSGSTVGGWKVVPVLSLQQWCLFYVRFFTPSTS